MAHVLFIHGIANKPEKSQLLNLWETTIANKGFNLGANGVTTSIVYWADVMYAEPWQEEGLESLENAFQTVAADEDQTWEENLPCDQQAFVDSLKRKLGYETEVEDEMIPDEAGFESLQESEFEAIPLPGFIKRRLMKQFVRDTHHYLFNEKHSPRPGNEYEVRTHIRQLFVDQLEKDRADSAGPFVIVSHSMGTVIAYDCLKNVGSCPNADSLLTIGSPLGLSEVQNELEPGFSFQDGYPEKVNDGWNNYYDRLDPVALDARLANDYKKNGAATVIDKRVVNSGWWRHSATDYLGQPDFVTKLKNMLGF